MECEQCKALREISGDNRALCGSCVGTLLYLSEQDGARLESLWEWAKRLRLVGDAVRQASRGPGAILRGPHRATERGACPLCHMETKPGEQLHEDGSCWPRCISDMIGAKRT